MPICFPGFIFEESPSPGSSGDPKRILVIMDGLREFSVDLLEWVLKNFTLRGCCSITLLGLKQWLNIPLSSKTWSDIWTMNLKDLYLFMERIEYRTDPRYQKLERLVHLCKKYGVVPEIRTEMGHPIRLLVLEQIISLHATIVVFDKYHDKKHIDFYAEKVPCSMVVMNDNEQVDLIKKRKCCDDTPVAGSPGSSAALQCSKSIIPQHLRKYLRHKL